MSPHDDAQDSTDCYPLTGRHLQVAAILGHHPHGGSVRLTVTELGQIGELVAWGQNLDSDSRGWRGPTTDADPQVGTRAPLERYRATQGDFEGVA